VHVRTSDRGRSRTSWLAGLAVLLLAGSAGAAQVVEVRVGNHPTFTRVVFELDAPAGYRIEKRKGPGGEDTEILVTLEAASSARRVAHKSAMVDTVAVEASTSRALAHIRLRKPPSRVKEMILANPPRIVFDLLLPEQELAALEAKKRAAAAAAAARRRAKKAEPAEKQTAEKPAPVVSRQKPAPVEKSPAPAPPRRSEKPPERVAVRKTPPPEPAAKPPEPRPAPAVEKPAATPKPVAKTPEAKPEPVAKKPAPTPKPVAEQPAPKPEAKAPAPKPEPLAKTPAPPPEVAKLPTPEPTPARVPGASAPSRAGEPAKPKPEPEDEAAAKAKLHPAIAINRASEATRPADAGGIPVKPPTSSAGGLKPPAAEPGKPPVPPRRAATPAPKPEPPRPAPAKDVPGPPSEGPDLLFWGGAAAVVVLLLVLVMMLRRRALPNDLDVTALAEDLDGEGALPEGGFSMDAPTEMAGVPAGGHDRSRAGLATGREGGRAADIAAGPGLFDEEPEKESEKMDLESQGMGTASEMPTQVGAGAGDGDLARLVRDLERRMAQLETRLDESTEARERLERQVAAQAEELRVQRAAIARTQRALRSLNRPAEEQATEPALRDG
jgi:hypothetical protein